LILLVSTLPNQVHIFWSENQSIHHNSGGAVRIG
jgi:hypothetical protein